MKKRMTLIVLVLICALALSACGCKHENVNEGNCETSKTCVDCGEILSEAPGHAWVEADCENAKNCSACGLTEGEALGHSWQDATTEAPKTCENCGLTEGERIITDQRFTTAATIDYQGKWTFEFNLSGEMMNMPDFEDGIDCILYLELCNNGAAFLKVEMADMAKAENAMFNYLLKAVYDQLAASGVDQETADTVFPEYYGMTIEEYVSNAVEEMDLATLFENLVDELVYYIEDGKIYMADSWTDEMSEPSPISVDGDTMILEDDLAQLGIEDDNLIFTRVVEE